MIRLALTAAAIAVVSTLFVLNRTPDSVELPNNKVAGMLPESTALNARPAALGAAEMQQPSVPTPEGSFPVSREDSLVRGAPPTSDVAIDGEVTRRYPARAGAGAGLSASCADDPYRNAPSPALWQTYQQRPDARGWEPVSGLVRVATDEVWSGSQSAYAAYSKSRKELPKFFWQAVDARPLRGKRIEVTVSFRVDRNLANGLYMFARILSGPSMSIWRGNAAPPQAHFPGTLIWTGGYDWTRRAVYADVPQDADALLYAMSTSGWVDAVRVSVVGEAQEVLRGPLGIEGIDPHGFSVSAEAVLPAPANLDFELPVADRAAGEGRDCTGGAQKM